MDKDGQILPLCKSEDKLSAIRILQSSGRGVELH